MWLGMFNNAQTLSCTAKRYCHAAAKRITKRYPKQKFKTTTASSLQNQISAIPKIRLFPSQLKLISKYYSFLSLNFPATGEVEDALISDCGELNKILAQIYLKNESFAAYADACIQTAEKFQMLRSLNNRRKESRVEKNLEKGNIILSDSVYELICRDFAARDDWVALERILLWLEEDGIPPTFDVCVASLECLGGILLKSTRGATLSRSLSNKLSTEERLLQTFLEEKILKVLAMAEKHNVNVYEGLLRYPRRRNSLEKIVTALLFVNPERQPDLSFLTTRAPQEDTPRYKKTLEITNRVSVALDKAPFSRENILAEVFQTPQAMLEAFQEQLSLETLGQVPISPALPFFEDMLKEAPQIAKSTPAQTHRSTLRQAQRARIRNLLENEQNTSWRRQLTSAFEAVLQRLKIAHTKGNVTAYPFLKILPKKSYVDLMIQAVNTIVTDTELRHVGRSLFLLQLGQRVETACLVWRKQHNGIIDEMAKVYKDYAEMFTAPERRFEHFREMWLRALQMNVEGGVSLDPEWPMWNCHIQMMVGQELYRILYDHLTFNTNALRSLVDPSKPVKRNDAPVLFEVSSDNPSEARYEIRVHPTLLKWYRASGRHASLVFSATELPMLCPPLPWIDTKQGGYLISSSDATRFIRKTNYHPGADAAANDDLDFDISTISKVFDSLNTLAACPWKVNQPILDAMLQVARQGGDKSLSLPETKTLVPIPPKKFDSSLSREDRIAAYKQSMNIRKIHDETRSLWATEMYRLSIANKYRDKVFWFPHSMDFRGRVYPCPPHFHHMGSDVARGLIVFAKGLPLGQNGLRWLKIHLANLTGKVKRSSNNEREAYTDSILDEVLDSADKPFEGRGWWREQEEPWQTLACCRELASALRHPGGPETYINRFPVHQDGSCNGLQHYAAMGRDARGAASVSLEDCERPRDVYTDVAEVVEAQRKADAEAGVEIAAALEGAVQRRVIKQSVMTTVYGVTLYGAMAQIRRQLRELPTFQTRVGDDADRRLGPASAYLARLTLASIGAIFSSSTATQAWFGKLAKHITRARGCRISWITPLGLPVVQPYVKQSDPDLDLWSGSRGALEGVDSWRAALTRAARRIERQTGLRGGGGARDSLVGLPPPNAVKQRNAFPPNFVHSLDSCHMMLTALHCLRTGVLFASVHDCFWTHAASVDDLNRICREEFVALHSEDVLENLSDYLRDKFEYSQTELESLPAEKRVEAENFNRLLKQFPKRGDFDLSKVLKSTYFFS